MVTSNEHLILSSEKFSDQVEMYLNKKDEIFVHNQKEYAEGWFFVITKEDWEQIKSFIDYQFS